MTHTQPSAADACLEPGSAPKDSGTEYTSNMTKDGAPGSHSALFGLAGNQEKMTPSPNLERADSAASAEDKDTLSRSDSSASEASADAESNGLANTEGGNMLNKLTEAVTSVVR